MAAYPFRKTTTGHAEKDSKEMNGNEDRHITEAPDHSDS